MDSCGDYSNLWTHSNLAYLRKRGKEIDKFVKEAQLSDGSSYPWCLIFLVSPLNITAPVKDTDAKLAAKLTEILVKSGQTKVR